MLAHAGSLLTFSNAHNTALAGGAPRVVERVVEVAADEGLMERIRAEMAAEIEAKVRCELVSCVDVLMYRFW